MNEILTSAATTTPAGTTGAMTDQACLDLVRSTIARYSTASADAIEPDLPLSHVPGIESVTALRAITEIEDACGVVIPDDYLFETATVRGLAGFIASLTRAGA